MRKVLIIGSPGAGKSTFARKLRDLTGLPLYYLDMIWHRPDQMTVTREEFDQRLQTILRGDRWIIDGNYQRTLETRLRECDTIFLFDIPMKACLLGATSRIGKSREDMPWVEQRFDSEFRQWIIDFPQTQLPQIYQLLEEYKRDRTIIVFKSRREAEDYLPLLPARQ